MMDYIAMGGSYGSSGDLTSGSNAFDGAIVPSKNKSSAVRKITDIVDGTSNSLLVGEKFVDGAFAYIPSGQTGGCNEDQGWVDGWDNDAVGYGVDYYGSKGSPPVIPMRITALNQTDDCGGAFGSVHESCMFVFCDGSVHSLGFDIKGTVWMRLCSINDGQVTGFED